MIICLSTTGAIILGLSRRNLELLQQGHPILKHGMAGLPTISIVYGEDEQAILKYLLDSGFELPSAENFHAMPTVSTRGH